MTPYYSDDLVTIYHGRAEDVLPTLDDRSADLLLTDPPYNFGFAYGEHDDAQSPEAYTAWCHRPAPSRAPVFGDPALLREMRPKGRR